MNTFRTVSRVLVVTAIVCVSSASAIEDEINYFIFKLVAPVAAKEILKNQSPYLSPIAEGMIATFLNHMPKDSHKDYAPFTDRYWDTGKYLAANVTSRELAVLVAANTRLNKDYFAEGCDAYVGAVPYVGKPTSKIIKKITPSVVETAHNSIAASVKAGQPTLEMSFTLG
jgi:hypothetical protein